MSKNMLTATLTWSNGEVTKTSINGPIESVNSYFLNKEFDIGTYPKENMQTCIAIELQPPEDIPIMIDDSLYKVGSLIEYSRNKEQTFTGKIKHIYWENDKNAGKKIGVSIIEDEFLFWFEVEDISCNSDNKDRKDKLHYFCPDKRSQYSGAVRLKKKLNKYQHVTYSKRSDSNRDIVEAENCPINYCMHNEEN